MLLMGENLPPVKGLAFKVNPEYAYFANYITEKQTKLTTQPPSQSTC
jgi:hypothetical protein